MFENTIVTSKAFGQGTIVSLNETPEIYSHMSVDFNGVVKKFGYPLCFEKHLISSNEDLTKRAEVDLRIYTKLEEHKKKARIRAILSKWNLLDEEDDTTT